MGSQEDLKKIEEGVEKDLKELSSIPKKTYAFIFLTAVFIAFLSTKNGIDENWARTVAGSLITVGGLLLGFFILGASAFSRKQFVKAVHEALIRKHVNALVEKAGRLPLVTEDYAERFLKEEFMLAVGRSGFSMGVMESAFFNSAKSLLASIGSALCLYGVSGSYAFGSNEYVLFWFFLYFSIALLLLSAYTLLKNIDSLLSRSVTTYTQDTYELIMKILDERIKEDEAKRKR